MKPDRYAINMMKSDPKHQPAMDYWQKYIEKGFSHGFIPMDKDRERAQSKGNVMATLNIPLNPQQIEAVWGFVNGSDFGAYILLLAVVCRVLEACNYDHAFTIGVPQLGSSAARHHLPLGIAVETQQPVKTFIQGLAGEVKALHQHGYIDPQMLKDTKDEEIYPLLVYYRGVHREIDIFREKSQMIVEADLLKEGTLKLHYHTGLYWPQTMERVKGNLLKGLEELIKKKGQLLSDVQVIPQEEYRLLLKELCENKVPYEEVSLYECFKRQMESDPNQIAIIFKGVEMTYGELGRLVCRYARGLRALGVRQYHPVSLMMTASAEMMALILALLKLGAIYVPIDPDYPRERIEYMVRDSESCLAVAQEGREGQYVQYLENIVTTPAQIEALAGNGDEVPVQIDVGDIAYIIYTSGTTGQPKGVMVPHRGVLNLNLKHNDNIQFKKTDRVLQFSNTTFDVSIWDIFGAFLNGATLVIPEREIIKDPQRFEAFVREHRVNAGVLSPVYGLQLTPENMPNFTYVGFCGSAVTKELARKWTVGNRTVINAYGPTEITVACTCEQLGDFEAYRTVPIGKPIANTKIYLLGKDMKLKPYVGIGEICVATHGIALGYRNKAELTAEKFIDNPCNHGEKLYRTGDLGRWTQDGKIEYLGRFDCQVKIRGYRIEMGEIEEAMLKIESLKQAAIVVRDNLGSVEALAAFYTANEPLTAEAIKTVLKKSLPAYMIPSWFVQLPQMPLNNSGKVDFKVLKTMKIDQQTEEYVAPTTETEKALVKIWQEILGVEPIGIKDQFFAIGGDSIKLMQVAGKLQNRFEFEMNDLFNYQTIETLAPHLKETTEGLKEKFRIVEAFVNGEDAPEHRQEVQRIKENYQNHVQAYQHKDIGDTKPYRSVMLTGATGYLGIHMLRDLMHQTESSVVVPVRGNDREEAAGRLEQTWGFYFDQEPYDLYRDRIEVVCGDLTQDRLGMDSKTYHRLTEQVDCIINSAAKVGHFGREEDFIQSNVVSVEKLIEFAMTGRPKDFNQISTVGIANGHITGKRHAVFTEADHDIGQVFHGLYEKTKHMAEEKIIAAREKGLKAHIFRMGNLVHNTRTGKHQKNILENNFLRLFRSTLEVGMVPQIERHHIDFSFVDQSSDAVIRLFNCRDIENEAFHIFNPHVIYYADIAAYATQCGYAMDYVPVKDYNIYLLKNLDKECVSDVITGSGIRGLTTDMTQFEILQDKTSLFLKKLNFQWQTVGPKQLESMINYCRQVGFLE